MPNYLCRPAELNSSSPVLPEGAHSLEHNSALSCLKTQEGEGGEERKRSIDGTGGEGGTERERERERGGERERERESERERELERKRERRYM